MSKERIGYINAQDLIEADDKNVTTSLSVPLEELSEYLVLNSLCQFCGKDVSNMKVMFPCTAERNCKTTYPINEVI